MDVRDTLRNTYKSKRNQLSWDNVDDFSLLLLEKLAYLPIWKYQTYHIFLPMAIQKEVNTFFLINTLELLHKNVVIPSISDQFEMKTHQYKDIHSFTLSNIGTLEPNGGETVISPDVIFVPLLVFNSKGDRLGYGKGYYDRYISQNPSAIKVGMSFFNPDETIPKKSWDVPLDYCVTPKESFSFISKPVK